MANRKYFSVSGLLLGLLILFGLIQFFRIDKTNPPVDPSKEFAALVYPPTDVALILKESCYDCHSNETTYPWYSNVAPASWFLKSHIDEGRHHLNFSVWGDYSAKKANHKIEECIEMVEKGEMPMTSYTLLHPKGKLSKEEKEKLVNWFKSIKK